MPRMTLEQGTISDLQRIADFVASCCEEAKLDERSLYHVKLAVDEACTNIFEHAYDGQAGRLEIEMVCTVRRVLVEIRDWGRTFDPTQVEPPDPATRLEERPVGGLGIFLMRQLMDDVSYRFDPNEGNCLTLRKTFV